MLFSSSIIESHWSTVNIAVVAIQGGAYSIFSAFIRFSNFGHFNVFSRKSEIGKCIILCIRGQDEKVETIHTQSIRPSRNGRYKKAPCYRPPLPYPNHISEWDRQSNNPLNWHGKAATWRVALWLYPHLKCTPQIPVSYGLLTKSQLVNNSNPHPPGYFMRPLIQFRLTRWHNELRYGCAMSASFNLIWEIHPSFGCLIIQTRVYWLLPRDYSVWRLCTIDSTTTVTWQWIWVLGRKFVTNNPLLMPVQSWFRQSFWRF